MHWCGPNTEEIYADKVAMFVLNMILREQLGITEVEDDEVKKILSKDV